MQFKPWNEVPNSRHLIDDEPEELPLVPVATLEIRAQYDTVLVVPRAISALVDVQPLKRVGHIAIEYPDIALAARDDFDEDEQLYLAASLLALKRRYKLETVPIVQMAPRTVAVAVPRFNNPITDVLVAREIAKLAPKHWRILAPSTLSHSGVRRLDVLLLYAEVPAMEPPLFVTGACAAVVSSLADLDQVAVLALNGEGHPGFEKVDADLIMEAAAIVAPDLVPDPKLYLALLSAEVRRLNSAATLGLYV